MFKIKNLKNLKNLVLLIKEIIEEINSNKSKFKNDKEEINKITKHYIKILNLTNKIIINNMDFHPKKINKNKIKNLKK